MADHAREMLEKESAFLSGVAPKIEAAKGRELLGATWQTVERDGGDRLRAVMARNRVYDRERLKELPQNRMVAHHGYRRTWWMGRKATGVAVASVLCPMDALVSRPDDPPPPIDLPELMEHVRRVATERSIPYVMGVCAPSGFTAEAKKWVADVPEVTLVCIEPRDDGGWDVSCADTSDEEFVLNLFDPEGEDDRVERAEALILGRSADLLTGGLGASSLAEKLGMAQAIVMSAMRRLADADNELKVAEKDGDLLLYRGAPVSQTEKKTMNMVDRIRQLFSKDGEEAEKINLLSERRAGLSQRRDRLYGEIGTLEERESELLRKGKESQSTVTKRRLAAQLAQLRKDISRQNTTANMLNKQIDIISTDIHNLTLIEQGNMADLPTTDDLTENAVAAEEMLETLQADAELVSSLETGLSEVATSSEELDILKEFEVSEKSERAVPEAPATAETEKSSSERVAEQQSVKRTSPPVATDPASPTMGQSKSSLPPERKSEPERRVDPES